jgi:hypothetical protein
MTVRQEINQLFKTRDEAVKEKQNIIPINATKRNTKIKLRRIFEIIEVKNKNNSKSKTRKSDNSIC